MRVLPLSLVALFPVACRPAPPSMQQELLPCVEIEPEAPARASVIWLHGLGADGHDFEPIVPLLGTDELGVRYVFPNAPEIPVTINGGMIMPAWYDVLGMELDRRGDAAGVLRSAAQVRALIEREKERGIPAERIVLAGFSQGGAIALYLALRHDERLAGLIALSTYFALEGDLASEASPANKKLPIFQAHGTHDPMVNPALGEAAHRRLVELGYDVEWHAYPMQHQVCQEEIEAVGAFLRRVLASSGE